MDLKKIENIRPTEEYDLKISEAKELLTLIEKDGTDGALTAIIYAYKYGYKRGRNEEKNATRKAKKDKNLTREIYKDGKDKT